MPSMAGHLTQLEELDDLEAEIIKKTKVHKVLRAILKLNTIPKEDEFNFKTRSSNLLNKWSGALAAETEAPAETPAAAPAPTTNGVKHEEETKKDSPVLEKSVEPTPEESKPAGGDVEMTDAPEQPQEKEDAPKAEADSNVTSTVEAPAVEAA